MRDLTVPTQILNPTGDKPLTPAMVTALWVIADHIDQKKPARTADAALVLEIPTQALRGEGGRSDNHWLRECLERLQGIRLRGEYRGEAWGSVMVGEFRFEDRGSRVKIWMLPSAVQALTVRETFTKIETFAAYKLHGHARRLYAALADKKNLRQNHWTYSLGELRQLLDIENQKSYERFNNLRFRVLDPALAQINDFGTVIVTMNPIKLGRTITDVRFEWKPKDLHEAAETDEENERADIARRKVQEVADAPPMMPRKDDFAERLAVIVAAKERATGRKLTKDDTADEADRLRDLMKREKADLAEKLGLPRLA